MDEKKISVFDKLCDVIDNSILKVGHIAMWANVLLIFIIILQVVLRYGFSNGFVVLEELQWHLYAIAFMTGLSYSMVKDTHIRVDLLYGRLSQKWKNGFDLIGIVFLLLPFIYIIFTQSIEFFYDSWVANEHSNAPLGLPWVWAIKSMIPIAFGLLFFAAISKVIRILASFGRI